MRRINPTCLKVVISQAGLPQQALMQINTNIPIDKLKYLAGTNLIDSIVPQSVPDISSKLPYLLEEIDDTQLRLLGTLLIKGVASLDVNPYNGEGQTARLRAIEYLGYNDNALLGTISISVGDKTIKHTL
jgi:hypothetical protein